MSSNLTSPIGTERKWSNEMKVDDRVTRILAGIPMRLKVTAVDDKFIHCGPWKFDKVTGAEVDEELGWGPKGTGSYLKELQGVKSIG